MYRDCKNRIVESVNYGYDSRVILKKHGWAEAAGIGLMCDKCRKKINQKYFRDSDYHIL